MKYFNIYLVKTSILPPKKSFANPTQIMMYVGESFHTFLSNFMIIIMNSFSPSLFTTWVAQKII